MRELIEALRELLLAEGQLKDGRKVYHFLLPSGIVLEVVA